MCLINGNIEKVSKTKILAANIGNGRQLTVYSNEVKLPLSKNPVAMILPYPKGKRQIQVIETNSLDNDFFKDIDDCFPQNISWGSTFQARGVVKLKDTDYLQVFRSGDYQYSLANSLKELERINPTVFSIKPKLQTLLQNYENDNYSFIVCIIDKSATYSPFAYITDIVNSQIFVPSKHYHEHDNNVLFNSNLLSNVYKNSFSSVSGSENYTQDWDHSIYFINTKQQGNAFRDFKNLKRYSFADFIDHTPVSNLHRMNINGNFQNIDIIVPAF